MAPSGGEIIFYLDGVEYYNSGYDVKVTVYSSSIQDPSKEGYVFKGWRVTGVGAGTHILLKNGTMIGYDELRNSLIDNNTVDYYGASDGSFYLSAEFKQKNPTISQLFMDGVTYDLKDKNAGGLPEGGTEGQVLTKTETGTEWKDETKELPEGGSNGQVLTMAGGERDTQGPCPDGYHVPTKDEWQAVYDMGVALGQWSSSNGNGMRIKLKMPFAGSRSYNTTNVDGQSSNGRYWSSSAILTSSTTYYLNFNQSYISVQEGGSRSYGRSVRAFRNSPIIPNSSWATIYAGSNGAGIYHNVSEGVISISSDGQTWITIADKNLGATTVYNDGDTLSQANCGNYYQWGNNYGFPRTGTISKTSSTAVDASAYGPGNYYSSDTWITVGQWDSSDNRNLRGGVTDLRPEKKAEWKDASGGGGNTKTFYLSGTSDITTAQAILDYKNSGNNPIISYSNYTYVLSGDAGNKLSFYRLYPSTTTLGYYYIVINYSGTTVSTIAISNSSSSVVRGNYTVSVVSELPATPQATTIYFVTA